MFIHRPDKYLTEKEIESGTVEKNVAELIVAKHRNGGLGTIKLYFKGESTKFMNMPKNFTPPAPTAPEPEPQGEEPFPGMDNPLTGLEPPPEEEIY